MGRMREGDHSGHSPCLDEATGCQSLPPLPKSIVTACLVSSNFKHFLLPRHFIEIVFQISLVFAELSLGN